MAMAFGGIPIIGETIRSYADTSTTRDTVVWTPWFPREGNALTSLVEIIAISSPNTILKVELFEKNSEDTGDGTKNNTHGGVANGAAGTYPFRNTSVKELVRYKITLTIDTPPTAVQNMYCHFRILNPSWESSGAQSI